MGKYRTLRRLTHLLQTKTAIVDAHCSPVARIDLSPFEVAHRIDDASGIEALPATECGHAAIPGSNTS